MDNKRTLTSVWMKEGWDCCMDNFLSVLPAVLAFQVVAVMPSLMIWKYFDNRWYALPWEMVIGAPMTVGLNMFFINLCRDRKADYGDLFRGFSILPASVAVSFLYGAIVTAGIVLLIIPGILWGLAYLFSQYSVIDRKTGIKGSFAHSSQITYGFKEKLLPIVTLWVMLEVFTPGIIKAEGTLTSMRLFLDLKPWILTSFVIKTVFFLPWLNMALARAYVDLVKHNERRLFGSGWKRVDGADGGVSGAQ